MTTKEKWINQSLLILLSILFSSLYITQLSWSDFSQAFAIGGEISGIEIYQKPGDDSKTYAYVAEGANLIVYNITDINNPIQIDLIGTGLRPIRTIAIGRDVLAVNNGRTLLYGLERPENPCLIYKFNGAINNRWIELFGNVLVIEENYHGRGSTTNYNLQVFYDISDPANPTFIHLDAFSAYDIITSFYNPITFSNPFYLYGRSHVPHLFYRLIFSKQDDTNKLKFISRTSYNLHDFGLISDNQTAFVSFQNKFSIYDLSNLPNDTLSGDINVLLDKGEIVEIASISFENNVLKNMLYNYPYIYLPLQNENHMAVIEISDIKNPKEVGQLELPFIPKNIFYEIAYALTEQNEISLMELSRDRIIKYGHNQISTTSIAQPLIEEIKLSQTQNSSLVNGKYRYNINHTKSLLEIIDTRNPNQLKEIDTYYNYFFNDDQHSLNIWKYYIGQDRLYVCKCTSQIIKFGIFDISIPTKPVQINQFDMKNHVSYPESFWIGDSELIILYSNYYVFIDESSDYQPLYSYDITDKDKPIEIEHAYLEIGTQGPYETKDYLVFISPVSIYYAIPKPTASTKVDQWQKFR